jgi:hypothetical protein
MTLKLGTTDATVRLGSATPAAVYLGSEQVWTAATVPGAPTILVAGYDEETTVGFTPPSDGGSPITAYKFYFDGVELTPDSTTETSASFAANLAGQEVEVSAVNAIGEGAKSDPVTVAQA